MRRGTGVRVGLIVLAGLGGAPAAGADVIYLVNGGTFQVDAWRDVGDAVEFAGGGGIIRIAKREIARIDGKPTSGDLPMYSAPASLSGSEARAAGDRESALRNMGDYLKQGADLFDQSVLSARSKADAFRRLVAKWRELDVPGPLADAQARGRDALEIAAQAYTAEDEGRAPDAKERVEAAKKAVEEARELVKKAGGG